MLNFKQPQLRDVIEAPADIAAARTSLAHLYQQKRQLFTDKAHWAHNSAAVYEFGASYTRLFMDKLWEAFNDDPVIGDSPLLDHLWLQVVQQDHGTAVNINYADEAGTNHLLLSIDQALNMQAHLTAHELPVLADFTATKPQYLLTEKMFPALLQLIKLLYAAKLHFLSPKETVLQPVAGLHFGVKFPDAKTFTATLKVSNNVAVPVKINVEIGHYDVRSFKVSDETDNDVTTVGKPQVSAGGTFSWEAQHLPELTNQTLTLTVEAVAIDTLPCLDNLFVTASGNNILMRTGAQVGSYQLELPNQKELGLTVNSQDETLTLHYPDTDTQIYELSKTYPFFGEWLEETLKTATNV
ncbi:hypothetical protein [Loigolactobacillus binensis]|uniref:Uncharacterized protein n=1 Tax=Loigolactobacillus binensis TaxID=2559922 RepID=A0ABW3ED43_9LACO|nr:hypothetical protein [Loigolactobacillus binensis]